MTKLDNTKKSTKFSQIIFTIVSVVCMPGIAAMIFFESVKPNANYLEGISLVAFVASMLVLIFVAIAIIIKPWDEIEFDTNKEKLKLLMGIPIVLIVFPFMVQQTVLFGIPLMLHPISPSETVQIDFLITEKDYDTTRGARRGMTCRYKLRFEHPDIPERNYLCATKSFWEQVEENSMLTVSVQKSRVAYYIPELR